MVFLAIFWTAVWVNRRKNLSPYLKVVRQKYFIDFDEQSRK